MTNIKLKKVSISDEDIAPRVLTAATYSYTKEMPKGYRLQDRYVYDYEFELITYSDGGSMIIDNEIYNIKKGDIVFRKPGQYTQGIMPYSCYLICVDMLSNTCKIPHGYYIYNKQEYQNYYQNPIFERIPTIFHPVNIEKGLHIFESILKEFITPSPVAQLSVKANILNLICYLYQDSTDPFINNMVPLSHHFNTIKEVVEYIENNLDNKILLNDFTNITNLSPSYFHKVFTKTLGITPHEFILKCRIDKAKKLLTRTSFTILEISAKCGFENAPYFSYVFKKHTKFTPLEFRKKHSYI